MEITEHARKVRPSWVLGGILLAVYLGIKLIGWSYTRQAAALEKQVGELRPGLSAIVLAEQLENTRRACEEITARVRQLDLKTGRLVSELSDLPASLTVTKVELRSRLTLPVPGTLSVSPEGPGVRSQHVTRIQGTLMPGVRDPETVLVQWAHALRQEGDRVVIEKLIPSFDTPGLWEFDLEVENA